MTDAATLDAARRNRLGASGVVPPTGLGDLTPEWMTAALAPLADGATVTEVRTKRIGNGMVADSARVELTWDRPTAAPDRFVAKVPAAAEDSRMAAAATRTYLLEAAFYNDLADTLGVHRPACYLALHDEVTHDYVVLLGDLAPAEAGDQITGCSVAEAFAVMPELAALHAPRWGDETLAELPWLDRPNAESVIGIQALADMFFPAFLDRYRDVLDPEVAELSTRFIGRLGAYLSKRPEPWTVVHGDFRLDNLLFGGDRVAVLDWQTVKVGPALSDVAYFIGSALQPAERREHEEALVREYHTALIAGGVDLSWDDCWLGYRRHGFDGLLMAILASMLVSRTDRGDEMFMAMANRHGHQLLDLDAEALIDEQEG